jgi:hypothetical protein
MWHRHSCLWHLILTDSELLDAFSELIADTYQLTTKC